MRGQGHAPSALPTRKRPGTHCIGGGWVPGSVWSGAENLVPTAIRYPDRPARSESLYQLSYPSLHTTNSKVIFNGLGLLKTGLIFNSSN